MKKILIILFGIVTAIIVIVIIFSIKNNENDLLIIKDTSCFSDFSVEGEKVYIECELTIKNSSLEDKTFQLNAIMKDDVELGLLKEENLKGYSQDLTSDKFTVEKKTTKTFSIVFVGDFAGTNKKHDRNLPEIVITTINDGVSVDTEESSD